MIRLILDFDKLYDGGDQILSVADYVRAYVILQQAANKSETVDLVVRDRTCAQWLRRALDKYGLPESSIVMYNARTATELAWNVRVPSSFSDADIAADRLWEYSPSVFANDDFENVVLRSFYAAEFASVRLPFHSLGRLLEAYDGERWSQNAKIRCVSAAYRRRLEQWQNQAKTSAERRVAELIRNDISAAKLLVEQFVLLRSYPDDVARRVIGQDLDILKQLGMNTSGLAISEEAAASAIPHIGVYLDGLGSDVTTVDGVGALLAPMSGQLEVEFQKTRGVLNRLTGLVDSATISGIRNKFSALRTKLASELERLASLVGPVFPSNPDGLNTVESWVCWATDEYLPYRFWCERVGHSDTTLDDYSQVFQEWLYANCVDIQSSSNLALNKALLRISDWIGGPEKWLFVIIADNLGVRFLPALQKALNKQGFARTNIEYALASLPTETTVAKKCLLGATSVQSDVSGLDYPSLAQRWQGAFGDRPVHYLADISKVGSTPTEEPSVIFLNYLKLDEILHEDQSKAGMTYQETAEFYFDGLAKAIRGWSDDKGISQDLQIAVVADHGSLLLDSRAANLIDTGFFKTFAEDRHHRFLRLSDAELEQFPGNLQQQCFLFPRQQHGLFENYAVAQRYYRFANTGDGCYAHGGLSPEEVVVPVVMLSRALSKVEMPAISLVNKVFRYGNPEVIELEVTNPGQYELEDVTCEFAAEGMQSGTAYCAIIDSSAVARISTNAKFRNTGKPVTELRVSASFVLAGQDHELPEIAIPIEVKSLVERKERRFR